MRTWAATRSPLRNTSHRARRDANVELVFGEAVGNAVIVIPGFDMIIETGAAHPPLGINIRLRRQRPELGPVKLFEELPAGDAEPAQRAALVDVGEHLLNGLVQLRQTVKDAVTQPAQEIALDDQNAGLDFGFVAGLARPCRENAGIVMAGELAIGPVDLGIVEASLDDGDLGVVRDEELWHAADRLKSMNLGRDPVRKALGPGRFGVGKTRRPEHSHEDLRLAAFSAEPVHDHWYCVARIVDKELFSACMRLAHDYWQLDGKAPVQFAKAR